MLNQGRRPSFSHTPLPHKQQGVVLFITLIILVAMTLAGMAMVRSVFTTNLIAGNLALQQAATHAGDAGTEDAIAWLETNNSGTTLFDNTPAGGRYLASTAPLAAGETWDHYWQVQLAGQAITLAPDAAGNTVSYVIQRLCNSVGNPTSTPSPGCAQPQTNSTARSGSKGAGVIALQFNGQIYYRITSRITGPRNTVGYVQTVVAL
jgi:Tfp pilus assembly protein PilX